MKHAVGIVSTVKEENGEARKGEKEEEGKEVSSRVL